MAVEEFKKAIKLDAKNPYFYKGAGPGLRCQQRKYDEADRSAFRKALELNPYYVDVRNDLGTALILSGKRDEGKSEFLAAFNDPTNPTPEMSARNLGQAYLEEKNYAEAAQLVPHQRQAATQSYPDAYLGPGRRAAGAGPAGRGDRARWRRASRRCPTTTTLLVALGEAYYQAGRFTEARARLEEVAQDAIRPAPPGRRAGRAARRTCPE